jgi:hypothetical protein
MFARRQRQLTAPRTIAASVLLAIGLCAATGRADPADPPDSPPDSPPRTPPELDRVHSDPFALRVEELVQGGTPREVAVEQARIELHLEDETFCLGFIFEVRWCASDGVHRAYKRINASCIDAMAAMPGVTPLTYPLYWAPPTPSPLPVSYTHLTLPTSP